MISNNNNHNTDHELLSHEDVEIATADTGAKALQFLLDQHFDCCVLDLRLPDMSGFELLDKLQGEPGEISLSSAPCRVILAVRDNGMNLQARAKGMRQEQGMGMRIMRYRASRIGGFLAFQPRDAGGVELVCIMPTTGKGEASR